MKSDLNQPRRVMIGIPKHHRTNNNSPKSINKTVNRMKNRTRNIDPYSAY